LKKKKKKKLRTDPGMENIGVSSILILVSAGVSEGSVLTLQSCSCSLFSLGGEGFGRPGISEEFNILAVQVFNVVSAYFLFCMALAMILKMSWLDLVIMGVKE
jgi:hypothetical protein